MKTLKKAAILILMLLPTLALANGVTYDNEILYTAWPGGTYAPGDLAMTENLAEVYLAEFSIYGSLDFGVAIIEPAFTYFGNDKIMHLDNMDVRVEFGAPGNASFEYLDLGGRVNLQVNGSAMTLESDDMAGFIGAVAPGVTCAVTTIPVTGGHKGLVTLFGPVWSIRTGGQEFWIDNMYCANGISSAATNCDYIVTHESLGLGTVFGPPGYGPGDYIFSEDGIDVYIGEIAWMGGGTGFNFCEVTFPGVPGFGLDQAMWTNNVVNRYDIAGLGITVQSVAFEFLDSGGEENLQVNGATLWVDNIELMPVNVAPGVTMSLTTYPTAWGTRGEVLLTGNVQDLVLGGQEFQIDNVCVTEGDDPVVECDYIVDHQTLNIGDAWGGPLGDFPGDLAFVEDNIPVRLAEFDYGSGTAFNQCQVQASIEGMGDSYIMGMNNISNVYDIQALDIQVVSVTFEFLSMGGEENIMVNGAGLHIGDIELAPAAIAPGVTYSVVTYPTPSGIRGEAKLTGHVDKLLLGGQEFFVDNICVEELDLSGVTPIRSRQLTLEPGFPNPFNPMTTLSFALGREDHVRLTIHDAAGRLVKTLIDDNRAAGPHQVVWDGRDGRDSHVAAGLYFVRVATGDGEVETQKIVMIK